MAEDWDDGEALTLASVMETSMSVMEVLVTVSLEPGEAKVVAMMVVVAVVVAVSALASALALALALGVENCAWAMHSHVGGRRIAKETLSTVTERCSNRQRSSYRCSTWQSFKVRL